MPLLLAFNTSFAQTGFTGKPMYNVSVKRAGVSIGSFTVELFPNIAPKHARNFDSLVGTQFYDTTAFHRVIPGFMIQGGDPNSRSGPVNTWGFGQPSQPKVNAEFTVARHNRGIIGAARSSNINSATSQFFINVAYNANLNGLYTVYGRVLKGMNLVDTIVLAPRNAQDRPNLKHEMFITRIGSNDTVPQAPQLKYPPQDSVAVDTMKTLPLKWTNVSDGIIYSLEVSVDPTFASVDDSVKTALPSFNYNTILTGNTWYYWRVRVNNGGHFSPWSQVYRFHTVGETTGIPALTALSKKIVASPNPGSGSFEFGNLTPGMVVKIFDGSGRLVSETTATAPNHKIHMNDAVKGTYFYKIYLGSVPAAKGRLILN